MQQLKKYYPEIHDKLKNSQSAKMELCFQKSIERGIELGLYRADIDIWFIEKLHRNAMNFLMDDEVVHKDSKSFTEYQNKYLDYHIRAIGTEKGIELLNELKQKLHEN